MGDIYFYKITVDDGGAPHVKDGVLSLAICKPAIRRTCKIGDIVIGFAANSLAQDNRPIYIAKITDKSVGGEYYRSRAFSRRLDCIYRWRNNGFVVKKEARFHSQGKHMGGDLGEGPEYPNAVVLLSTKFIYWGCRCAKSFHAQAPNLAKKLSALTQGHRVNHGELIQLELQKILAMYGSFERPRVLGRCTSVAECDEYRQGASARGTTANKAAARQPRKGSC